MSKFIEGNSLRDKFRLLMMQPERIDSSLFSCPGPMIIWVWCSMALTTVLVYHLLLTHLFLFLPSVFTRSIHLFFGLPLPRTSIHYLFTYMRYFSSHYSTAVYTYWWIIISVVFNKLFILLNNLHKYVITFVKIYPEYFF